MTARKVVSPQPAIDRFEERARLARRGTWRTRLRVLGVVTALVALVWLVGFSSLLTVRTIEVTGMAGADKEALVALGRADLGTPLARVDTDALAAKARQRKAVAEARVDRSWPHTLVIHVVARQAALVVEKPNGQLEVVDAEGIAFGTVRARPTDVPLVRATSARGLTPEALGAALSALEALPANLADRVDSVTVSTADLVTLTMGKTTVVWGGRADAELKVQVLTALLKTGATRIDVSAPNTPVTS